MAARALAAAPTPRPLTRSEYDRMGELQFFRGEHVELVRVAESSLEYDRETKAVLYAACGVPEYWIIDVAGRAVEVYTGPDGGRYSSLRHAREGDRISPAAFADVVIAVNEVVVP